MHRSQSLHGLFAVADGSCGLRLELIVLLSLFKEVMMCTVVETKQRHMVRGLNVKLKPSLLEGGETATGHTFGKTTRRALLLQTLVSIFSSVFTELVNNRRIIHTIKRHYTKLIHTGVFLLHM